VHSFAQRSIGMLAKPAHGFSEAPCE